MTGSRKLLRPAGALAVAGALIAGCGGGAGATVTTVALNPTAPPPAPACSATTWVAAWAADPSDTLNVGLVNQTVRTILTPNLGGETVRVRLSNRFSAKPVSFQAATLGRRAGSSGAAVVPGSVRQLTFGGQASVTVAGGADIVSDPAPFHVTPSSDLAVSVFTSTATGPATEHAVGQQTSYASPPGSGDHASDASGAAFVFPTNARYYVAGVDVRASGSVGDVVAFGDSITDGFGGPPNGNDRYPDFLSRRLAAAGRALAVVNAGIGGNRILDDARAVYGGPAGRDRLGSDAIGVPGVSDVIVLEGINDISRGATAAQVIAGLQQLVTRLHAAGLRVQLGTLTPFGASLSAGLRAAEATRLQVNRWIRAGGGGADGTVDFDAAVRDAADATRLDPRYDSGDHIHPNAAGRQAMAGAVDLAALHGAVCTP